MKKIKKLSLSGLAKESVVLSMQEQMNIYAGSGIDGLCFFEGLEILSGIFGCNYSESYYVNNYASTHGGFSSIMVTDSNGNWTGGYKGVDSSDATGYLTSQFAASAVGLGGYSAALASGQKIMVAMNNPDGTGHAIVITGYDASTGKYVYTDANGAGQQVSSSQLNMAMSMAVSDGFVH